MISCCFWG